MSDIVYYSKGGTSFEYEDDPNDGCVKITQATGGESTVVSIEDVVEFVYERVGKVAKKVMDMLPEERVRFVNFLFHEFLDIEAKGGE